MKNTISLNRNEQFLSVYRNGKRAYHKCFTMYYMPNKKDINRLGFKVSKKLAKAVKRNRLRRLMRECYRLSEEQFPVGYDIILAAREGSLEADTFQKVSGMMDKLFLRSGLLQKPDSKQGIANRDK